MSYTTLISAEQLKALLSNPSSAKTVRIFDCTFDLTQPALGEKQYLETHIRGAVYASLDTALSAKHGVPGAHGVITATGADAPASGGRHPLPNREKFAIWLSSVGFANDMQAVVYDRNGANYCGRLWWMLKWAGHANVAVLDGGLQAWQAAGGAVANGEEPAHFQSNFELAPELAPELVPEPAPELALAPKPDLPGIAEAVAQAPLQKLGAGLESTAQSAAKPASKLAPQPDLSAALGSAGLTLASTDPEKLRAAQEAAAQAVAPKRVPRERKPRPQPVDEPLVQVDTQRN